MATFEALISERVKSNQMMMEKFPLRRLEPAIEKFIKVLHIDLDRLEKHRQNISKYQRLEDSHALNREYVNSSRTVQQLKGNMRELEQTRLRVLENEVEKFDLKVSDIQSEAVVAVNDFMEMHKDFSLSAESPPISINDCTTTGTSMCNPQNSNQISERICESCPAFSSVQDLGQGSYMYGSSLMAGQIQMTAEHSQSEKSWEELKENLLDLNGLIHSYSNAVHSQQETIDRIEDNIETAQENVEQGVFSLASASKMKTAMLPVIGAVAGTLIGGPVGLAAGLKIGGMVAVGGSIAGFTGGRYIKQKQQKVTEAELENLSRNDLPSTPGLTEDIENSDNVNTQH